MKPLTINFYVEDNKLQCSEHNFLKGDNQIIKARFSFPEKWNKAVKVAKFTHGDMEFEPQVLQYGSECYIPEEAIKSKWFRLEIIGKTTSEKLKTNTLIVYL